MVFIFIGFIKKNIFIKMKFNFILTILTCLIISIEFVLGKPSDCLKSPVWLKYKENGKNRKYSDSIPDLTA
jgi:hypothetical protein